MSEAFLMRRGGSAAAKNAYALIAVSYPAGSACTASDGVKTLKAESGNGAYCFAVPYAGTWTVTIRDGEHGDASESVVISAAGQVEKLTMSFQSELFNAGTGKENWSTAKTGNGQASANDTLYLQGQPGGSYVASGTGYVYTTAALSLNGKQSLEVTATTGIVSGFLQHTGHAQLRIVDGENAYNGSAAITQNLAEGSDVTTSVDISGLDAGKQYRIVFFASGAYAANEGDQAGPDSLWATVNVSRVRLL